MKQSEDGGFDEFWSSYPKRVKKLLALKEWRKLKDVDISAILSGVARWKQSAQWQDVQFIPDPERFLKYRRWEDEIPGKVEARSVDREGIGRGPQLSDEARERLRTRLRAEGKIQ